MVMGRPANLRMGTGISRLLRTPACEPNANVRPWRIKDLRGSPARNGSTSGGAALGTQIHSTLVTS